MQIRIIKEEMADPIELILRVDHWHITHRRMGYDNPVIYFVGTVTFRQFKDAKSDFFLSVSMVCEDGTSERLNTYKHFFFEKADCMDYVDGFCSMIIECHNRKESFKTTVHMPNSLWDND